MFGFKFFPQKCYFWSWNLQGCLTVRRVKSLSQKTGPRDDSKEGSSVCLSKATFMLPWQLGNTGSSCWFHQLQIQLITWDVPEQGWLSIWWKQQNRRPFLTYDVVCVCVSSDLTMWWSALDLSAACQCSGIEVVVGDTQVVEMINRNYVLRVSKIIT